MSQFNQTPIPQPRSATATVDLDALPQPVEHPIVVSGYTRGCLAAIDGGVAIRAEQVQSDAAGVAA